jgi:hypothetical protein
VIEHYLFGLLISLDVNRVLHNNPLESLEPEDQVTHKVAQNKNRKLNPVEDSALLVKKALNLLADWLEEASIIAEHHKGD